MASGIGHYIHFQASDYINYGIADPKSKTKPSSLLHELLNVRKDIKINSSVKGNAAKAKALEEKLNSFYTKPRKLNNGQGEDYSSAVEDFLYQTLTNLTDNIEVDINRLEGSYETADLYKYRGKGADKLMADAMKQESGIRVATLRRNFIELGKVLENLSNGDMINKNGIVLPTEIEQRYEKAMSAYNKVRYEIFKSRERLAAEALSATAGEKGKTFNFKEGEKYTKIIKNFQEAYMELRDYLLQTLAIVQGQLGEYGTAAIIAALESTTLEELKEVLSQLTSTGQSKNIALTGSASTKKVLLSSNLYIGTGGTEEESKKFIKELNAAQSESEKKFQKYSTVVDGYGNIVAATKSQDKVDLSFTLKEDDEKYNLSIKNYDFDNNENALTIHSGNLLRLIQDYHVFINHMLNILPQRKPSSGNDADLSMYATAADRILKELIAYKGLTGGVNALINDKVSKTAEVNYFVVNKRTKDNVEFKVYDMNSLMQVIFKNPSQLSVDFTPRSIKEIDNEYAGKERDVSEAYRRARRMVVSLARIGIVAKIKKEVIN